MNELEKTEAYYKATCVCWRIFKEYLGKLNTYMEIKEPIPDIFWRDYIQTTEVEVIDGLWADDFTRSLVWTYGKELERIAIEYEKGLEQC